MSGAAPSPRVALATYAALPALNDDDQLLLAALVHAGASAAPAVWDDPAVDWSRFDVVVVRSCWDYHLRHDAFLAWLSRVDASGARLVNPVALLRWNADKRYLRALERDGIALVPTAWVERVAHGTSAPMLAALLAQRGWSEAVVKPAISASAHDTWRTSRVGAARDERRFSELLATSRAGVLVQPFVPEVALSGELSLVFLGGAFSHATLKRPAAGDFRVQWEHGGSADPVDPPRALVRDAESVLAAAARQSGVASHEVAYARVDGVERAGRLVLMELECLEPHLFLSYRVGAADDLARAVMEVRSPSARPLRDGERVQLSASSDRPRR
jgi:glutathione synthase/RimK-type ligase-like ATP-grasp enzyme